MLGQLPADAAALDIVTVVSQYPEHRGHTVQWRCKVEQVLPNEILLLGKRKILADDHLDYFVRIELADAQVQPGDKVQLDGVVQGDLKVEQAPGSKSFYLTLDSVRLTPLESATSRNTEPRRVLKN